MTRTQIASLALALTSVVTTSAFAEPTVSDVGAIKTRPAHSCGTKQRRPTAPPPLGVVGPATRVVYLNRMGATFNVGAVATNSSTNAVSNDVLNGGSSATAVIAPLNTTTYNWTTVKNCILDDYDAYPIEFTEVEPASGNYVELIIGGDGTELGYGANQLFGIAAADNFCYVNERGIAFTFAETHDGVPQRNLELCATASHELGHVLGLEHETLATDNMSYVLVDDTTSKSFVDANSTCGVYPGQPDSCYCTANGSSATQTNSHQRLLDLIGAGTVDPPDTTPPTVTIVSPDEGGTVRKDFEIEVTATDNVGVDEVIAELNGVALTRSGGSGSTYRYEVTGASEGPSELVVTATDARGNDRTETVSFTVSYECDPCGDAKVCVQGECMLINGETCTGSGDCAGGECIPEGDVSICSERCTPDSTECGDGFVCVAAGDGTVGLCIPGNPSDGRSGGCATGGSSTGALASGLLLLGAIGLSTRRRRRRA